VEGVKASVQAVKAGQAGTREVVVTPTYAVGSENDGLAGGLGWPLPALRAQQKLVDGRWILLLP
jgi:ATP-dependent RNA helicase DHX37/DHR1